MRISISSTSIFHRQHRLSLRTVLAKRQKEEDGWPAARSLFVTHLDPSPDFCCVCFACVRSFSLSLVTSSITLFRSQKCSYGNDSCRFRVSPSRDESFRRERHFRSFNETSQMMKVTPRVFWFRFRKCIFMRQWLHWVHHTWHLFRAYLVDVIRIICSRV